MYVFISMVCLVLFRVYSSRHPLPLLGKACTHFPAWGKLFNGTYHAVRLSVMRVFGHLLGSLDFLGHKKSWPRRKLCRVFMFRKNKQNNKMYPDHWVSFPFRPILEVLKVDLLSWLHFSHLGKYCVHGVLSHPFFLDGKLNILRPLSCNGKNFSLVLKKNLLLMVSYSYPMFLLGSKC